MKPITEKRTPTAEERKHWQAAAKATNVEQERVLWNPIVEQLQGHADIDSAVDFSSCITDNQSVKPIFQQW